MLYIILQAYVLFSYLFSLSFDMNFVYRPEYDDEHGTRTCYDNVYHKERRIEECFGICACTQVRRESGVSKTKSFQYKQTVSMLGGGICILLKIQCSVSHDGYNG